MEEYRFCTRCGAELPDGASFCPECGSPIGQDAASDPDYHAAPVGQGIGFLGVMILLYGILAVISGLMDMISSIGLTEAAYHDLLQELSNVAGMDISEFMPAWSDNFPLLMTLSTAFVTISGVLAIVCYYKCKNGGNWKTCVTLCAASSIACLGMGCFPFFLSTGVVLCTIGLLVTVLMYTRRDAFPN